MPLAEVALELLELVALDTELDAALDTELETELDTELDTEELEAELEIELELELALALLDATAVMVNAESDVVALPSLTEMMMLL